MANTTFSKETTKVDLSKKTIAVFPLIIDSLETNIYAVVNYTDSTTILTSKYTNYPGDVIGFFDNMIIDSTQRTIEDMPDALTDMLYNIDNSIKEFSENQDLVNTPLNSIPTKAFDEDFMPPPGCRVEVENVYSFNKSDKLYGPKLTTQWHQDPPYNEYIPSGDLVGCGAVALGQLMKYHTHPTNLPYILTVPYHMMKDYENPAPHTARFLHHVATMINTKFGHREPDGSGGSDANMHDARVYLENFYDVSKNNVGNKFENRDIDNCEASLRNSNPVMISANRTINEGHTWLIDGYERVTQMMFQIYRYYDQNNNLIYIQHLDNPIGAYQYFHHNLGWGQRYNVWLNVRSSLTFDNKTYDRNIDLFYVTKK